MMWALQLICWTVALCSTSSGVLARFQDHSAHLIKRSAQSPDPPENVLPKLYHLDIQPYLEEGTFSGSMRITVTCKRPTYNITLRAGENLQVTDSVVKQTQTESSEDGDVRVSGVRRSNDDLLILDLEQSLVEGREYQLKIPFSGSLGEGRLSGRFYRDSYIEPSLGDKRWYALTDLSTSSAHNVFPCFSDDSHKTPFLINIVRKDNLSSLSNMPLLGSQDIPNKKGWTLDRYQMTPPMSPSSVSIFVSNFKLAGSTIIQNTNGPVNVSIYGQENLLGQLPQVSRDVSTLVKVAQRQFGVSFPLPALSIIALPKEYQTATNHSGWGVVPIHAGKTYIQDDLWHAMTLAADEEEGFPKTLAVKTIINSWFTQDHIPLVEVNRTYSNNSAIVEQHILSIDLIPSKKDDIRWAIPLIYLTPKNLDGDTARPAKWMEQETQVELSGLPSAEDFIIVNPVEGSLFMVNYDMTNWNLLADYIKTSLQNDSLPQIDRVTRTKVIQDTFNLAFSEKLDYGVTLNMSRALQYERDNLVWFQVNNLILHLRTLLFGTRAGDLVQRYFLFLLNSAIERGIPNAPDNQEHTLCKLADPDCIRSKQNIYDDWMNNDNTIKMTPLSTTLCPVLTSGTDEEFDYGLRAMLNKTSNERLRILRCLASGCLTSSERMERFENKRPAVWEALIKAATSPYLTEKGYERLESFYKLHEGEFGEQEELVKVNLRDSAHLTTKWEGENLPTIVSWVQDNWDGNRVVTK
uniref:Aminopeptidase n=1 Tax=Timema tahoe TaxID=61484 RepID=A0A7R9FFR8_9NEOP|nr:unnamed protein product [Timema tahoe]